jgi:hypothetical protein
MVLGALVSEHAPERAARLLPSDRAFAEGHGDVRAKYRLPTVALDSETDEHAASPTSALKSEILSFARCGSTSSIRGPRTKCVDTQGLVRSSGSHRGLTGSSLGSKMSARRC